MTIKETIFIKGLFSFDTRLCLKVVIPCLGSTACQQRQLVVSTDFVLVEYVDRVSTASREYARRLGGLPHLFFAYRLTRMGRQSVQPRHALAKQEE